MKKLFLLFLNITTLSFASHITNIEAISEVFGDGEKLSSIILTYDKALKSSSVSTEDFFVPEREIKDVYVSRNLKSKSKDKTGEYVIVELKDLPMVDSSTEPSNPQNEAEKVKKRAMGLTGPTLGSKGRPKPLVEVKAEISQIGEVQTKYNEIYLPELNLASNSTRQLVIEDFVQNIFVDEKQNNETLAYNLYIPKNYNPNKKYPLVVFMHDAGTVSPETKATLSQGLGAIAWASPEWQEKYPSFVLAPQYDTVIVNDKYEYGPELDRTIHLIESLSKQYSIDTKRIYNTGQSMGGMANISLDSRYTDFFAASYIIGSKWDVNVTAPLATQNIWFVVSENDPGAKPSIDAISNNLENHGASIKRFTIDANQDKKLFNQEVKSFIDKTTNIYYTTYIGGSHRYTWQHSYSMFPAMEWIFSKSKK